MGEGEAGEGARGGGEGRRGVGGAGPGGRVWREGGGGGEWGGHVQVSLRGAHRDAARICSRACACVFVYVCASSAVHAWRHLWLWLTSLNASILCYWLMTAICARAGLVASPLPHRLSHRPRPSQLQSPRTQHTTALHRHATATALHTGNLTLKTHTASKPSTKAAAPASPLAALALRAPLSIPPMLPSRPPPGPAALAATVQLLLQRPPRRRRRAPGGITAVAVAGEGGRLVRAPVS